MIRVGSSTFPIQMGCRNIGGRDGRYHNTANMSRYNIQFPNMRAFAGNDAETVSFPEGFNDVSSMNAIEMSYVDACSMAATFRGEGFVTTAAKTIEQIAATLTGNGNLTINAQLGLTMAATFQGNGTLTISAGTIEKIAAVMDAGARPSANDIAQAVWATLIEAGFTASTIMKFVGAMAAGDATGLESGSPTFKKLSDNTQTRMGGTYSSGTRTITTKDVT